MRGVAPPSWTAQCTFTQPAGRGANLGRGCHASQRGLYRETARTVTGLSIARRMSVRAPSHLDHDSPVVREDGRSNAVPSQEIQQEWDIASGGEDGGNGRLPDWALSVDAAERNGDKKGRFSALDTIIISNALICTAAAVAEPLMGMADTAFVGHLGLIPLASLGPNNTASSFISFFAAFSLSVATTDRIATCRAKAFINPTLTFSSGVPQEGALSMSIALSLAVYVGVALGLVMFFFPHQVLNIIGANEEIMPMAVDFMRIRALSIPAMLITIAIEGAYRAFLDLRTPFLVIAGAALMNVILNALFIFGFGMGVAGSALATTLSTWASAIVFLLLLNFRDRPQFSPPQNTEEDVKQYASFLSGSLMVWRAWRLPTWRHELATISSRCGTLLLRASLIVAVYSMAGAVAARIGTLEVAGHQVLRQLIGLQVCLTYAYMSVGQTLVANLYQAGGRGREIAGKVAKRVIVLGSCTAAVLSLFTWFWRHEIPKAIVSDPAALQIMFPAMLPACVMLLASANNAFEGVLLGAGDAAFCSRCFVPAACLAVGMLWAVLKFGGGLTAIWWALAAYYSILLVLFAIRTFVPAARGPLRIFQSHSSRSQDYATCPTITDKLR